MLLGSGVLAFATPAPSPRAETASVPAMVASAILFFALIRKPLSDCLSSTGDVGYPVYRSHKRGRPATPKDDGTETLVAGLLRFRIIVPSSILR